MAWPEPLMIPDLLATLAAGVGVAGAGLLLKRRFARALPALAIGAAAIAAMITTTIVRDYQWLDRYVAALPDNLLIPQVFASASIKRPWTYLADYSDKLIAIDPEAAERQPDGRLLVPLQIHARWTQVQQVQVLMDCRHGTAEPPDPVIRAACSAAN